MYNSVDRDDAGNGRTILSFDTAKLWKNYIFLSRTQSTVHGYTVQNRWKSTMASKTHGKSLAQYCTRSKSALEHSLLHNCSSDSDKCYRYPKQTVDEESLEWKVLAKHFSLTGERYVVIFCQSSSGSATPFKEVSSKWLQMKLSRIPFA